MRIAAYQFAVTGNIKDNFNDIIKAIDDAKNQNVDLLIFPECALTGYPPRDITSSSEVDFDLVESLCDRLQDVADTKKISFVVGTIYKDTNIYNRAILFQPGKDRFSYDKRALWGWDKENFTEGTSNGLVEIDGIRIGFRICFEVRFPEYFRELYKAKTDVNLVLFYDVTDNDDIDRYNMIRGHLQTRAVENVTTTIAVNSVRPYQSAPTIVFDKSGKCIGECARNVPGMIIYDFEKATDNFGEVGRRTISDLLCD